MSTQTVSAAVAKREAGPINIMWSRKRHFEAVLPKSVDVEAFLGTAAGALYASDVPGKKLTLMQCAQANPDSLIIALMHCAALGHLPGTDEYYLTPRTDHGRPKVLGIEGYRGVVERMYRSGAVKNVIVREVCAKDLFSYVEGEDEKPVHSFGGQGTTGADFFGEQGFRDRGPMVGVYAYAVLMTGAVSRVAVLNKADVLAARDSGGYKPDDPFTPWNRLDAGLDHPEFKGRSMWWKTGAKRLEPWVPTSAEYRREQLRAAASAASLSQPAPPLPPEANGHAAAAEPQDIQDAEIVEDQPDPTPASGAGPAPGSETIPRDAPETTARPASPPAGKSALEKLDAMWTRLGITDENGDQSAVIFWLEPQWTASRKQVSDLGKWLEDHLKAAQGDTEAAASAIWTQYLAANPGGGAEPGDE